MADRRRITFTLVLALAGLLLIAQSSIAAKGPKILEFDTMVGVTGVFKGSANPIRTINGGGLAWTLSSARGELSPSGHLEVKVRGVVLAEGANAGSNPVATFRAVVSCLDSTGAIVNGSTDAVPATTGPATSGGGNADIEATLALPDPCFAPIIFVTSGGGAWFTVTGG